MHCRQDTRQSWLLRCPPVRGRSIAISVCVSVCLFVCLFARVSQKLHVQISPNFLQMLPVTVAQSFSGGNAVMRYAFPVLWMTTCFHIIERICQNQRRRVCFVQSFRWRHRRKVCRLRLHLVTVCILRVKKATTSPVID